MGDGVLFTELMHAIYPHLAGERNAAAFMRDILERLSSVPEALWFTARGKAPGEDKADETLRKWYTRGLPKSIARKLLANPTRENLVDSLNYVNDIETESADEVKAALVAAVEPFANTDVDVENIGDVLLTCSSSPWSSSSIQSWRMIARSSKPPRSRIGPREFLAPAS